MKNFLFYSFLLIVVLAYLSCKDVPNLYYEDLISKKIDMSKYDVILIFADHHCSECKEDGLNKLKAICLENDEAVLGLYLNSYSKTSFQNDEIINNLSPEIDWSDKFSEHEKLSILKFAQQQINFVNMPILIYLKDGKIDSFKPLTYIMHL